MEELGGKPIGAPATEPRPYDRMERLAPFVMFPLMVLGAMVGLYLTWLTIDLIHSGLSWIFHKL